jgi:hypothetical protein
MERRYGRAVATESTQASRPAGAGIAVTPSAMR